jgi:hypothetical protein
MRMSRSHLHQWICVGILSCLVPTLCFPLAFPTYPVRAASDYALKAEQSSLTIGVQPLDNPDEQKTYFHTKLSPKGFLPVFVVIHNAAATESYIFDKAKASLIAPPAAPPNKTPQLSNKAATAAALASWAISMKMTADNSEIEEQLLLNELHSTTLSPGASVHGFLYIPIPNKGDRDKIHLKIPMLRSASNDETVDLDLVF